jgi:hypothetical protein
MTKRAVKKERTLRYASRLKSFRNAAWDIELLLVIPGGRDLEEKLHHLLSDAYFASLVTERKQRLGW